MGTVGEVALEALEQRAFILEKLEGFLTPLPPSFWLIFREKCQSTPKQRKSAAGARKKQRNPARQGAVTRQLSSSTPPPPSSPPPPAAPPEREEEEEELATGPRPPHQEARKANDGATLAVRVKQEETEEEREAQGQRDMPSVLIKPEPEEMECTVRKRKDSQMGPHLALEYNDMHRSSRLTQRGGAVAAKQAQTITPSTSVPVT
ncbi:uncharacterized protein LOC118561990 [Fundulus heteroclitus]|uniref:uncharacterized protein LOC118561990 n=1 Tax=Fundulus heteroclitus TaxID=8078 RepID=UPI00165AF647|nr:uncharacterized protein LOC118561990 [Fundulus heteroclitus]